MFNELAEIIDLAISLAITLEALAELLERDFILTPAVR
jgi:hypothetical protein